MIRLRQWIKAMGVTDDMDFDISKRVRIINQFCSLSILIILMFVGINFYHGKILLALVEIGIILIHGLILYLNSTKRYLAARIAFFFTIVFFYVLLTYSLARHRDLEFHFIICIILPLILFDKPIIQYLLAGGVYLLFLGSLFYNQPYQDPVYYLNTFALFGLIFYLVKYFKKEYDYNRQTIDKQIQSLERVNEEKNQLLSIASHDLRSPINQVKGLLSIIQLSDDKNSAENQELLEMSQKILVQQSEMITRVLSDFVINENAGYNKKIEEIEVSSILSGIVDTFRLEANRKRILLKLSTPEGLTIRTDKNFFTHIFDNLISNAIKFSYQESSVQIDVEEQETSIRISVQDEGQGLSEEDKKKLFQKFQKLSAQPTFGEISTGLGLSIVKKYTDALEGKIAVESEKDKGAKFVVEIPRG